MMSFASSDQGNCYNSVPDCTVFVGDGFHSPNFSHAWNAGGLQWHTWVQVDLGEQHWVARVEVYPLAILNYELYQEVEVE